MTKLREMIKVALSKAVSAMLAVSFRRWSGKGELGRRRLDQSNISEYF